MPAAIVSRRSVLAGLFAAPAIVRAASLMPVRAILLPEPPVYAVRISLNGTVEEIVDVSRVTWITGINRRPVPWWNTNLPPEVRAGVDRVRALKIPTTLFVKPEKE